MPVDNQKWKTLVTDITMLVANPGEDDKQSHKRSFKLNWKYVWLQKLKAAGILCWMRVNCNLALKANTLIDGKACIPLGWECSQTISCNSGSKYYFTACVFYLYHCHMVSSEVSLLQQLGIEVKHIPGGCTSLCQTVNVGINRSLKTMIHKDRKSPVRKMIVKWVMKAYSYIWLEAAIDSWRHSN